MQIVTVNLPTIYIDALGKMVNQEIYPSRSEAIRVALRDFISTELEMIEKLLDLTGNEMKPEPAQKAIKKIDMRKNRAGWN